VSAKGWFGKDVFRAVRDATLELKRGETLGIVGESGSGKTTLGMALLALQPVAEGEITLEGTRLDGADRATLRAMRRRMQVVFQDPFASLSPRMTIEQIVGEGVALHMPELTKDQRRQRILAMLAEVGLSEADGMYDVLTRYPHEFSGGQRQRIGVARALALNPRLIICDEPVSALDVSIQAQMINLLEDLQQEFKLTYLFIAHDLSVVKHTSTRVAVMYLGKVVEIADSSLLYVRPRHPYTEALLSAVPIPDPQAERARRRIILEGDVPSPANPPSGCAFHPRCSRMQTDPCTLVMPPLVETGDGNHQAACYFPTEYGPGAPVAPPSAAPDAAAGV
jgi:oligopeptide/dipeptide ABC transporter ATP-binding protein